MGCCQQRDTITTHLYFWFQTRSTTEVGPWHLKFREQDISLTKNYCITINIKIISFNHIFILKIQVLGSHKQPLPFLTRPTEKRLNQLSAFLYLYLHAKNQVISSVQFWDAFNFKVPWQDWPHPFLTTPNP